MKKSICLLAIAMMLVSTSSFGQAHALKLRSGNYMPELHSIKEVTAQKNEIVNGKYYRFIQFSHLPSEEQKADLRRSGIELYNYIPHNTYMASIPASLDMRSVSSDNIISVFPIAPIHKLDKLLAISTYPEWAKVSKKKIELVVTHHPNINHEQVKELLLQNGIETSHSLKFIDAYKIVVDTNNISKVASLPFIYFVELTDGDPIAENLVGRTNHRSNILAPDYGNGLKFNGAGVHIALNDDGVIGPHIDYEGRIVQQYITNNSGDHGDHCAGIIFGGGNRNPTTRGMAWGADLGVYGVGGPFPTSYQAFDSITNHYNNKEVRITSTSYGNGNNAGYTSLARLMDVQTNDMPELLHVFSAGNSGTSNFGYGAGAGWGNITGGHKQAKNVIATGNLTSIDALANSSSRGPAYDGRIKPDICAVGTSVYSTTNVDNYTTKTGTSMACPAIAGVSAQLYQAYKETHNGNNPNSALIKGILLNTADDLGNPGPDYKHGWGRVNARRAYDVLAANQFIHDTVANNGADNHTISVPANVAELRVMLYWHDYEATANASQALVNDLNLTVSDPSSQTIQPWVLNPAPNATTLDQNATRGVDALNNVEQVTISNPAAGNYTINVMGTQVPQGPQPYFIVYEMQTTAPVITYPSGNETFTPSTQETIRWDAYGNNGTFTLEYSTNNGATWTTISSNIAATQRYYNWTPPTVATGQALMRITRGAQSDVSDAPFTIIGVPVSLDEDWVCIDSMQVSYSTVPGASGYIVSILGDKYMDSVGYSTTGTCVVRNIDTRTGGWFTVQAIPSNGGIGKKSNAVPFQAVPFNCGAPQDVALTSFTSPTVDDAGTCRTVANISEPVSVVLRNNCFSNISNVTLKYTVNGGTPNSVTYNGPLGIGYSDTISFTQPFVATVAGNYTIKAWLELSNGINTIAANDTITMTKNVITIAPKSMPYVETFEAMTECGTTADCEKTSCLMSGGWYNDKSSAQYIDWRINSGPTPDRATTGQTGPDKDFYPGNATGKYAYIEASQCYGKEGHLISPCIDMNGAPNAMLTMAYHMFGSDMGTLHVDIFDGTNWTNDITTAITGNQQDGWKFVQINISSYIGKVVNFRFRGTTGNGVNSDMAVDFIRVESWGGITRNNSNIGTTCSIVPNPSTGVFNLDISTNNPIVTLTVTNVSGKVVFNRQLHVENSSLNTSIDLAGTPSGLYFLTLDGGISRNNYKLVKM